MLQELLPPGKLWSLVGTSWLRKFLLAAADELTRVHDRAVDLLYEVDPTTTYELLPDFEAELDVPPNAGDPLDVRRGRVIGRLVRRQRFRPVDFQVALAPVLGLAIASVEVIEYTRADVIPMRDDRQHYHFLIFRDWAGPGAYDLAAADKLIVDMKPSHTYGQTFETKAILCDDPHSLCDRDLLGA